MADEPTAPESDGDSASDDPDLLSIGLAVFFVSLIGIVALLLIVPALF